MQALSEKVAVVTGGTSGIGLAVAKNFVESGADVVICGRRDEGEQVATGIGATFVRIDATDEQQVSGGLAGIEQMRGKIDVLVINAGIADDEGSIEDYAAVDMRSLVDTNIGGVFLMLKYGPRHMCDGGSIITTGSAAGSGITNAGAAVYAATKAGAAYLTRTCAIEVAERGIRANTVCPALIADTGMMTADDGGAESRVLAKLTAFGRMGRLDEVVGIYNFLAGAGSTFITGQEIRVDGGMTAGLGQPIMESVLRDVAD